MSSPSTEPTSLARPPLGRARVVYLRSPQRPAPPLEAFARAHLEVLDLAPTGGDAQTLTLLVQALGAEVQALVLDLEEEALAAELAEACALPVVFAAQASLIHNLGRTLAALEALELTEFETLRLALAGEPAALIGEVLRTLGVPEEGLQTLPEPGSAVDGEVSLLLLPEQRCGRGVHPSEGEAPAEVGLIQADPGLVLPFLVRCAADTGAELDLEGAIELARTLVELGARGELPAAEDTRLLVSLGARVLEVGSLGAGEEPSEEPGEASGVHEDAGPASDPAEEPTPKEPSWELEAYREALAELRSPLRRALRPAIDAARTSPRRIVFSEAEDPSVLWAARSLADAGLATPVLVGDLFRLETLAREHHLSLKGLRVLNPRREKWGKPFADALFEVFGAAWGLDRAVAGRKVLDPRVFAALCCAAGEADALVVLCEAGEGGAALEAARPLLMDAGEATEPDAECVGVHLLASEGHTLALTDTLLHDDPPSTILAAAARQGAALARRLFSAPEPDAAPGVHLRDPLEAARDAGLGAPRVALLGAEGSGATCELSRARLRRTAELLQAEGLAVAGPISASQALADEPEARAAFPSLLLPANLWVLPNRECASSLLGALTHCAGFESLGPILTGLAYPLVIAERGRDPEALALLALVSALQVEDEAPTTPLGEALRAALTSQRNAPTEGEEASEQRAALPGAVQPTAQAPDPAP